MTDEALRPDLTADLGALERQVFLVVRMGGKVAVADVVDVLKQDGRDLAYTTVMTILSRLWKKGYVLRWRRLRAYLYEARTDEEISGIQGERMARDTITKYGDQALTGLVRTLTPEQRRILAGLLMDDRLDVVSRSRKEADEGAP
ncbi:BlaI/MecI/CopY family transcriptional regulator [bacterium]|nr:BlaI/MecI/CopY family transcriptional regulator [bacterium]